jgi:hypothetical protein
MVAKIHLISYAMPWFEDVRDLPHFLYCVALSAPISQFKKIKALDMITICASWANTCRKL